MASFDIATQLELSRKDLLDLSFRNPLLNYRPLKARGVAVVATDPAAVFSALVRDNKRLSFREAVTVEAVAALETTYAADTGDDFERYFRELESEKPVVTPNVPIVSAREAGGSTSSARKRSADELVLQTASLAIDLQKRLLNTQYAARIGIEEQGVNTLFLSLGMLSWYDPEQPGKPHLSPLLLIPVELERAKAGDRFYLRYTGDEIGDNVSLNAYLENSFGLSLPALPPVDELNVVAYCEQVELLVGGRSGWSVDPTAIALGFFSFSKYLMYRDLDMQVWPEEQSPEEHPLLRSLLGAGFHEPESRFADDQRLDAVLPPTETRTVVDADSSQILAIEDVKAGRSLIIQGPPGTGKSQTITNIIAEAIGQGKTVLFVAEKQAALQVVKSRLDTLELGNACLELHSDKASKKAVLAELKRTLDLGKPVAGEVEHDTALLLSAQTRLNEHSEAINTPIRNSGRTLYGLYGEWLRLRAVESDAPLPELHLPGCEDWTALEFQQREERAAQLQAHLTAMGIPARHPYFGSARTLYVPTDAPRFAASFVEALAKLSTARSEAEALGASLDLPAPETPYAATMLIQAIEQAVVAPSFDGMRFGTGDWLARRDELTTLLEQGEQMTAIRAKYARALVPEAWEADVLAARQAVAAHGPKWYRLVIGDWRDAQKRLAMLCAGGVAPKEWQSGLELLDAVREYQRTRAIFQLNEALGATLFGAQWQGERSNWPVLRQLFDWIVELHCEIGDRKLPKAFLDFLSGSPDLEAAHRQAVQLRSTLQTAREAVHAAVRLLEWNATDAPLDERAFAEQETVLTAWSESVERISEIAAFNQLSARMAESGIAAVTAAAFDWPDAAQSLTRLLRTRWYEALMRAAYEAHPELSAFTGAGHRETQERFKHLDVRLLHHNKVTLATQHWEEMPRTNGMGQLRVLTHQFALQRGHLPIRRLIADAGKAVQAIKPVFMMSPLSVATYLPQGQVTFDLVVFDEASQVKPVDAFGALVRGKQAVVVGDSKQLPPSSFFDKLSAMDGDPDEIAASETKDIESVLELCAAQGLAARMLQWHYRSRHESLIAVSNREFYENKLVIFPSPDAARTELGLIYRYLPNTVYDRGKSGTNRLEAQAVAEAVFAHARAQLLKPRDEWLTLGVAAFSMAQMQEIYLQVELLRRLNPDCELFFGSPSAEPFFVKNLENVQGDERDIIYISVGYGRDKDGKVGMNFGPLNRDGGERRLNVLITRARLRCEVFTNLTPDDIDRDRSDAEGVRAFQEFLAYARSGPLAPRAAVEGTGLPFEQEVIAALREMGHETVSQVGSANYFVDIAVVDPERPGRYVLGIECDGPNYHSAHSARDRDRLRETVLRRMGWGLHRIWSTDWFHRRSAEIERLRAAVTAALAESKAPELPVAPPAPIVNEIVEPVIERVAVEREQETVPEYEIVVLPPIRAGHINELSPGQIAMHVERVVGIEGPVHIAEVTQRIADALAVNRVTQQFRASVEAGCRFAASAGRQRQQGDFLWRVAMTVPPLRTRANCPARMRQIDRIAPEEIAIAVRRVVADSFGIAFDDIARQVCLMLGIERTTAETKRGIDAVVTLLLETDELQQNGGYVVPKE